MPRSAPSAHLARAAGVARAVVAWQLGHGRHDLPWQRDRDPYRVWVSEIMLQQTQVATVIGYYERFLARFPTVAALAAADDDAVMAAWSGLGYYSRARNLHRTAGQVAADGWPDDVDGLSRLPGIGESTAAAIATFCFGRREAILDGNVRRLFARYLGLEAAGVDPRSREATSLLWRFAREVMADPDLADAEAATLIQGQMDLGAAVCSRSRPSCAACPLRAGCQSLDAVDRPTPRASPRRRGQPWRQYRLLLVCQPASAGRSAGVWLERRPAVGLWGGLWSLPELGEPLVLEGGGGSEGGGSEGGRGGGESADANRRAGDRPVAAGEVATVAAAIQVRLAGSLGAADADAVATAAARPGQSFDHVFTHFRMRALIHRITVAQAPVAADPAGQGAWVFLSLEDAGAIAAAPLATPVRKLLLGLRQDRAPGSGLRPAG